MWHTGQFIHSQFHDVVKPANADFCVVCNHYASFHVDSGYKVTIILSG